MAQQLNGKTVAILATDGFEQAELEAPKSALENAGANVDVIAPKAGQIQGLKHMDKGDTVRVDHTLDEVSAQDYDAIVLPGGVFNPDQLRTNDKAIAFVRDFFAAHKPVGAICHFRGDLQNASGQLSASTCSPERTRCWRCASTRSVATAPRPPTIISVSHAISAAV